MPQETLAGLGTKIYIGKAQADGSLPHIEEMTEVDVKESAPLSAESNGERKGWNNTFSVSLTAHVTDEEKETRKAEAGVAIAISKQVLRNIEITRHKIRSQRIHGRRRKAMYRDLLRYLIRTYTNEGDTILDNCIGSGTTAIACHRENRHFIGFELNKEYYDKALKRIKLEQQQLTLF